MDLWATVKVLFRRWLLVVPVLLIGFGVTLMVVRGMPDLYRSHARLLLLSPAVEKGTATDPEALVPVNPYMRFGGGQEFSTNVIQDLMNSEPTRRELHAAGLSDTWTLAVKPGAAPNLDVIVEEATPAKTMRSMDLLLVETQRRWRAAQKEKNAEDDQLLTLDVVVTPSEPTRIVSGKVKAAGVLGALTIAAAAGLAFAVEGFSRRRQEDGVLEEGDVDVLKVVPDRVDVAEPRSRKG